MLLPCLCTPLSSRYRRMKTSGWVGKGGAISAQNVAMCSGGCNFNKETAQCSVPSLTLILNHSTEKRLAFIGRTEFG